ncbi:MAG: hypothetical protein JNM56_27630 [Planctomycetia bacterium]|nr:hypothetical protein [Planctomycetia bacterium]
MSRRQSFSQQIFPTTAEFTGCLKKLRGDGMKVMLGYVWAGFDSFKKEILDKNPPPTRTNTDLERDLTEMLYPYILRTLPAALPYYLLHERKEREKAILGRQPPEPDLSFVLRANIRVTFPMDAKVLERDAVATLTDYADTVRNRFLTGGYAPFSKEGAMIAFLLAGSVRTVFQNLAVAIGCTISQRAYIAGRQHRTSSHVRSAAACQYTRFRCHHMILPMSPSVTT